MENLDLVRLRSFKWSFLHDCLFPNFLINLLHTRYYNRNTTQTKIDKVPVLMEFTI